MRSRTPTPADFRRLPNEKSPTVGKTLPTSAKATPSTMLTSGSRSSLLITSSASPPAGTPLTAIGPTAFCAKPRNVVLPPAKNRSLAGTLPPMPRASPTRTPAA